MTVNAGPNIIETGLTAYLDASNPRSYPGTGSTWFDLSGNGRNFSWFSSPSYTAAGSQSYFSTLGNRCTGPASNSFGINNTSGYTIFLVHRQNSLTQNAAFKFYGDASYTRGISIHCAWTDNNIYFDQGGCCNSDTRTFTGSGGTLTWNIWVFRRATNGSTRSIIKNGSALNTNTAAAANINLNTTPVDLGSSNEYGGNSSQWDARLNSFMVYNRGLSDSEVKQNFNALRSRYNV